MCFFQNGAEEQHVRYRVCYVPISHVYCKRPDLGAQPFLFGSNEKITAENPRKSLM